MSSKTKNPFVTFTQNQVAIIEASCYTIQTGLDFYTHDSHFIFNEKMANKHYNKILKELRVTIKYGTPKEKYSALTCIANLRVEPVRIH